MIDTCSKLSLQPSALFFIGNGFEKELHGNKSKPEKKMKMVIEHSDLALWV